MVDFAFIVFSTATISIFVFGLIFALLFGASWFALGGSNKNPLGRFQRPLGMCLHLVLMRCGFSGIQNH